MGGLGGWGKSKLRLNPAWAELGNNAPKLVKKIDGYIVFRFLDFPINHLLKDALKIDVGVYFCSPFQLHHLILSI